MEKNSSESKHKNSLFKKITTIVISLLIAFSILYTLSNTLFKSTYVKPSLPTETNTLNISTWQTFNSIDEGFKADFPNYPQKTEGKPTQTNGITSQVITFVSNEGQYNVYMVALYKYDIVPSNYNVKNGLEGAMNGFAASVAPGGTLTNPTYSKFGNYQALDFAINATKDNIVWNVKIIIRDDLPTIKIHTVASTSTAGGITKHDQFVNSFAFAK